MNAPYTTDRDIVNLTELIQEHKEEILTNEERVIGPFTVSQGRGTLPGVNMERDLTMRSQITPICRPHP